ncbi:TIGR01244 family sulfur transferase [Rhodanobacter sp. DHG33]|uniref:TIGR01244 family sulfur transferase n=1 Tax=Rhodanobacter sp. DHG33 TaxID=2775921 RepID=UPI0017817644|nr:TIGR01244 family sulfur transferase [Rhodanobacter sp. DHG33]MBD8898645.1 TIGR01244 family phosphatase [Rhodanobacter sp. DHG33]
MTAQIHRLTPTFGVAPQLDAGDIATLAAQGWRSLVCNRPDGEAADQPASAELAQAAAAHGLAWHYLPVVSGQWHDADITAFAEALRTLPAPVLAFCRSGTRSIHLWALAMAGTLDDDSIQGIAADAGYVLNPAVLHRADASS